MENYEDIRLWSLRFQLLRPMETLPVPYEVVLEKQVSPTYHIEGHGRSPDHTQIVCTISGEGAFRLKEKVYKLTPGMAFMSQLGNPDTAYYYPGHAAEPWIFLWISFEGARAVEIIREMNERYGYVFQLPLDSGFVKHLESYRSPRGTLRFVTPTEGAKIVHDALASLGDTIEQPEMLSRRSKLVRGAQELITTHLDRSLDLEAVAHTLQVGRRLPHIPVVRTFAKRRFQLLRLLPQIGRGRSVEDLHLIRQVDGGFVAAVVEVEPAGKLLPGVKGQQIQFQQQLRGAVLYYPEEVHQLTLDVVVHLELAGFLAQQHSAAAAKDFNVAPEFLWEHRQDDRQQVRLVADAGYWGSDRLSHAPIQIETAGTVPGVRLLYRPLGLIFFLSLEHLSLQLRRFFIDITSLQGLQIFV